MTYVIFFVRATLLVVFSAAVVGKLHSRAAWSSFVEATGDLLRVRRARAALAALAVSVEMGTVACLSIHETAYTGIVLALIVLTAFLIIVVSGVIRGVRTACNCFGSGGTTLAWAHVWRNTALASIAALGTVVGIASKMPALLADASYATPLVLSVIVAALFVMWDDFTDLILAPSADDMTKPQRRGTTWPH